MRINRAGLELIKRWEGLRTTAYKCPANVWTIGYGHTGDVKEGDKITTQQAETLLLIDLAKFERFINAQGFELNENQYSALVSLCYNIGPGNFKKSPIYNQLKSDPDSALITTYFLKHVYAGGRKLKGLINRRMEEIKLYNT
jgi:lysozyme